MKQKFKTLVVRDMTLPDLIKQPKKKISQNRIKKHKWFREHKNKWGKENPGNPKFSAQKNKRLMHDLSGKDSDINLEKIKQFREQTKYGTN